MDRNILTNMLKEYAEANIPKEYKFAKEQGVLDKIINGLNISPLCEKEGKEIDIDGSIDELIKKLQNLQNEGYDYIDLHAFGEYIEDGEAIMVWKDIQESEEKMTERLGKRLVNDIKEYYGLCRKEREVQKRLQKYK